LVFVLQKECFSLGLSGCFSLSSSIFFDFIFCSSLISKSQLNMLLFFHFVHSIHICGIFIYFHTSFAWLEI
jgi:hypothetical protein